MTLISIIANLLGPEFYKYPDLKILICAPSNSAADNIAERLQSVVMFQNRFIRVSSEQREDILNFEKSEKKQYNLVTKSFFE